MWNKPKEIKLQTKVNLAEFLNNGQGHDEIHFKLLCAPKILKVNIMKD